MKDKLLKNWGFKILALLLGFIVWFFVANIEDYSVTKTITGVPVTLLNQEAITDQNKVFEITQGGTVSINVRGRRSIVEELTADDFLATADLSELSITNAVQVSVEAHSVEVRREVDITVDDGVLVVAIEDRGEEKIPVTIVTKGNPQDGYAVINTTANPNAITVTGAAGTIKKIASIQVEIDVDQAIDNQSVQSSLRLLDYYGEEINQDKLELSNSSARVRAYIQKTKEVPIVVSILGEPAEGYAVAGDPEYDLSTVMIAGSEADLKNVNSIQINDIDVTDSSSTYVTTVDISDYLPSGITMIDQNRTVEITIPIEQLVEKTLVLRPANIEIVGKQEGFDYRLPTVDNDFSVTIIGLSADVNEITAADFGAVIDVSNLNAAGSYNIPLKLKTLANVEYSGDVTDLMARLTMEEIEEGIEDTSSTSSTETEQSGTTEAE